MKHTCRESLQKEEGCNNARQIYKWHSKNIYIWYRLQDDEALVRTDLAEVNLCVSTMAPDCYTRRPFQSLVLLTLPLQLWTRYDNGFCACHLQSSLWLPSLDIVLQSQPCYFAGHLDRQDPKNAICLVDSSTLIFSRPFFFCHCLPWQHSDHYKRGGAENVADNVNA